jgi:GDP-L-fucose synthase
MSKSKVIVTGGGGFLGKAVNKTLKDNLFYDVVSLGGKREYDLTNQKQVDYLYKEHEPDVIVHLAAKVGGIGANKDNPGLFMYENLVMGMNLIETARKYGKLQKFVMVGTVCAYPKFTPVPFKEDDIWNGYPEETNAPYGIAKKALMEMLIAYNAQYGINCTNLIPVNMYGPNDNFHPAISHVIPAIILKIDKAIDKKEGAVELWGTGKASREFLYVDDCAEAIKKAVEIDTTPHPINVGTGHECTIKDLANKLGHMMNYEGYIGFNTNSMDGQPRRCLETSRATKVLGFEAKTGLDRGLHDTVSWYYKNKDKFVDYFDYIQ